MKFVVDACIACSMGAPETTDPISKNCRDVLMHIFTQSHKIVVSDHLFDEYQRNASRFFNDWFLTMLWKKRVEDVNGCENLKLRQRIKKRICDNHNDEEEQKAIIAIVLKDVHLLESALITDNFIISNDNKCKNHLIRLIKSDEEKLGIAIIIWVIADEKLIEWFENGANIQCVSEKWRLS
jgi:hypothetical protein